MMRWWTVPLSSWRWALVACCMGMDVRAHVYSVPVISAKISSAIW